MPKRSVQDRFEGHVSSIDRAAEICDALGLEFYVGPSHGTAQRGEGLAGLTERATSSGTTPARHRLENRPGPNSDNPTVEPEPWPTDAEIVGELVWVARTLVGPRRR